jgi:hypothetical protein
MPNSTLITNEPGYLYAEFRSPTMGFIDDVKFYFDEETGLIQFPPGAPAWTRTPRLRLFSAPPRDCFPSAAAPVSTVSRLKPRLGQEARVNPRGAPRGDAALTQSTPFPQFPDPARIYVMTLASPGQATLAPNP